MSKDIMDKYGSGQSISQTADRTKYRGVRRLYERDNLRRDRLHRVLNILDFLPEHYAESIDFENHFGQFKPETEVKLNYVEQRAQDSGKPKFEFLFKASFQEMVVKFREIGYTGAIPYDWTIYYLRTKALTQKIDRHELAWVILNFNQKRGYYQLRGEDIEEDNAKNEEYHELKVKAVEATEDKNNKGIWYNVILENDWIYRRQSQDPIDNWIGLTKAFIVTTTVDKQGVTKRSFRSPKEDDWTLVKKRTEQEIANSGKSVGEYIFETLLSNPRQKIRGELIKTIERDRYEDELESILTEQKKHHPELQDSDIFNSCLNELYPRNEAHQNNLKNKDVCYLIQEDIIFYQRQLKTKKSTIASCPYESRSYQLDGEKIEAPLKCISKSHPLYQEFRIWQFIQNLKIYQIESVIDGKTELDVNVTEQVFKTVEDYELIFEFLSLKKEIKQKQLIDFLVQIGKIEKADKTNYRWNYVEDREYPCNETKAQFLTRLTKVEGLSVDSFLTPEVELELWHLIFSVKDPRQFQTALKSFSSKKKIHESSFFEAFKRFSPFPNEYGAYSEKALKKLVPLMRMGKYWDETEIVDEAKRLTSKITERLETINFDKNRIEEVLDDEIPKQLLKSFIPFKDKNPLTGLNTFQACYAVYERHSESGEVSIWKTPKDIDNYLNKFKQHSLRNPIVEQVVLETLRVVRDIWNHYGNGEKDFFTEIHLEMGRDLKNSAKKRDSISKRNAENERTNNRVRELLNELMNDSKVEGNVRSYSPSHQEILKLYEEGVYQSQANVDDEIEKIRKNSAPSLRDIQRYKLWLEQGYRSPYTGKIIQLTKLFTTAYQIEHVIPQSRYFDDSLQNKVICESDINEDKSNMTAFEYMKVKDGSLINGHRLLKLEDYEKHVSQYFGKNKAKLKNLLSEEVPEGFINRQMNDSRYISKFTKNLLGNIVREEGERETTVKRLIPISGAITAILRQDWGLNDKWNELIAPRFERLNQLRGNNDFGYFDKSINAFRTQVPDEVRKAGFEKKRIDHRHHALDALVIAVATKDHVNYITSLNTERKNYALVSKLRRIEELEIEKKGNREKIKVAKNYLLPWPGFPIEAFDKLSACTASFKQNLRVINKTNNKYWKWVEEDGEWKKKLCEQTGQNFAVRKAMHKETVSGQVQIKRVKSGATSLTSLLETPELIVDERIRKEIKRLVKVNSGNIKSVKNHLKSSPITIDGKLIQKTEAYEWVTATATRTSVETIKSQKHINSITDSGIQKILTNHLVNYLDEKGDPNFELAFSPEGVVEMNQNIKKLNNGKDHQPISHVRLYEVSSKFSIGQTANKASKFVEAAKGTNLFFAVYYDKEKQQRSFETIPLEKVIAHQAQLVHLPKHAKTPIPLDNSLGQFLFSLSPNDLVYVPTNDEIENPNLVDFKNLTSEQTQRIYRMVKTSGVQVYFIQANIASLIYPYIAKNKFGEFGSQNLFETLNDVRIKDRCWKLIVNKLGLILSVEKGG